MWYMDVRPLIIVIAPIVGSTEDPLPLLGILANKMH